MQLEKAKTDMKTLLLALGALHSNNIIHKSVSTRNIVYDGENCIKLAGSSFDRGLLELNVKEPFEIRAKKTGREDDLIGWQSPEAETNEFFVNDEQDDLWCLGRTFLEVFTINDQSYTR
jgi:serine/threonine protein kinase